MHAAGRVESVSTRAGSRFPPEVGVPAGCGLGRHSAEQLDEAAHILATLAEVPQRATA
jgi:hypothetical protein